MGRRSNTSLTVGKVFFMDKRYVSACVICLLTAGFALGLGNFSLLASENEATDPIWETWRSESYTLSPRESFQIRFAAEDVPARRWLLVVDGGDWNCDLSVLRYKGEELVYFKTNETKHQVVIPWGLGEELNASITNRSSDQESAFVVSIMGPPRDQVPAVYSYGVNRALEAFSSGQRLKAEKLCRNALVEDDTDAVAMVLLAGFQRDRQFYDAAAVLIDKALAGDLPKEMYTLAETMQAELVQLRQPLPKDVVEGLERAGGFMDSGQPDQALTECDKLLDGEARLDGLSRSRLLTVKGRALEGLSRNFEAVDAYTEALGYARAKKDQAVVYFHMGQLYLKMENRAQAQGAFTIALQNGLPSGLELQARESLTEIERWLSANR